MGNWISVNDRLPEDDEKYLTHGIDGITARPYNTYHECWDTDDGDDYFCDPIGARVTHWMPLPETPNEK